MRLTDRIFNLISFRIILSLSLCLLGILSYAQNHEQEANKAFDQGKYKTAINKYNLVKGISKNKILLAKRGLTYYKLNKLSKAIVDFTNSKKLGNEDPNLYLLMAQTKQHLNEYEEAAFFYKEFVKSVSEKDIRAVEAKREMKNCTYSAFHQKDPSSGFMESFGDNVNTYYDEIYVLQSPQFGNKYYFTSNRNLKSFDLFSYEIDKKGKWELEKKFGKTLNTKSDEYVMDISANGKSMIFVRNSPTEINYKIYVSTFDESDKEHIIELPDYLIDGAVDLQIVDYNTIAFSSKDLGGEGGYDIFTIKYKNGVWSDPLNEGPEINTEYDERSPFFDSTSDYLYFSSNRPYCFGGFDVYYYNKLAIDSKPKNMGQPINSSGNDLQFRLNLNGQTALMSSDRKTGEGSYDIYFAYLNDIKPLSPKDDRQLEYIKDYYNYINAKSEEALAENSSTKKKKVIQRKITNRPVRTKAKKKINNDSIQLAAAKKVLEDIKTKPEIEASSKPKAKEQEVIVNTTPKEKKPANDIVEQSPTKKKPRVKRKPRKKTIKKKPVVVAVEKEKVEENKTSTAKKHKSRTFEIKPFAGEELKYAVFYQDRHDLMNEVNKDKINKLIKKLKKNKDLDIHLIAHTDHLEPGLPEFMQYNTLKRANLVARYMMEKSISKDRISIESVSANYPLTKPELAGNLNTEYLAYNKRIDFELRNKKRNVVAKLNIPKLDLPSNTIDRRLELYNFIKEEVYYSVQIASTEHIYKNAVLRLFDDIYIRKENPTANNKYYVGLYTRHEDAVALQKDLKDQLIKDSKIVAFYNGFPIKQSALEQLSEEYPDLSSYMTSSQE